MRGAYDQRSEGATPPIFGQNSFIEADKYLPVARPDPYPNPSPPLRQAKKIPNFPKQYILHRIPPKNPCHPWTHLGTKIPRSGTGVYRRVKRAPAPCYYQSYHPTLSSCCREFYTKPFSRIVKQNKSQFFSNNTFFHRIPPKNPFRNRGLPTGDTSISQGLRTTAKKKGHRPGRSVR